MSNPRRSAKSVALSVVIFVASVTVSGGALFFLLTLMSRG